jgi:hypothetical protein
MINAQIAVMEAQLKQKEATNAQLEQQIKDENTVSEVTFDIQREPFEGKPTQSVTLPSYESNNNSQFSSQQSSQHPFSLHAFASKNPIQSVNFPSQTKSQSQSQPKSQSQPQFQPKSQSQSQTKSQPKSQKPHYTAEETAIYKAEQKRQKDAADAEIRDLRETVKNLQAFATKLEAAEQREKELTQQLEAKLSEKKRETKDLRAINVEYKIESEVAKARYQTYLDEHRRSEARFDKMFQQSLTVVAEASANAAYASSRGFADGIVNAAERLSISGPSSNSTYKSLAPAHTPHIDYSKYDKL